VRHQRLCAQVLSNIATRLADMHAAGYVHRDLKPANVMWLPRENRWTVIDFGCAARIGSMQRLSFTLAYSPPEVVLALEHEQELMKATTALDAWALGIMAVELLTRAPAFRIISDGFSTVRQRHYHQRHHHQHILPVSSYNSIISNSLAWCTSVATGVLRVAPAWPQVSCMWRQAALCAHAASAIGTVSAIGDSSACAATPHACAAVLPGHHAAAVCV
jgi:serine/threonine protein kinase